MCGLRRLQNLLPDWPRRTSQTLVGTDCHGLVWFCFHIASKVDARGSTSFLPFQISANIRISWSERRDLNSGPPVPQTGALTGLRYAPKIGGTIGAGPLTRNIRSPFANSQHRVGRITCRVSCRMPDSPDFP